MFNIQLVIQQLNSTILCTYFHCYVIKLQDNACLHLIQEQLNKST